MTLSPRNEKPLNPTILVCPLNWGLGHATRCIPLIREFVQQGCPVVVASEGAPLALLREEFGDQVDYELFRGMAIHYSPKGNQVLTLAFQMPAFFFSVMKEHRQLQKIIRQRGVGVVVSDNRFGLWSRRATTVFITHQVFIQAPLGMKWLEPLLYKVNNFFIRKFDHCWVPDFSGQQNLSGILAHKKDGAGLRFVGPLTRFRPLHPGTSRDALPGGWPENYTLVILSGPEPQRSILENILMEQFDAHGLPVIFVRGLVEGKPAERTPTRLMINHPSTPEMQLLISKAQVVVCRAGYSTLMDLSVFGKKALLIPTPGQTEQEYLGQRLRSQGYAHCIAQGELSLARDLQTARSLQGIPQLKQEKGLLQKAVSDLLQPIQ